jgi:putative ABC transport system permease protein
LIETVIICLVGGVVGMLLATGMAATLTANRPFAVLITSDAGMIACGFSTIVGVFFGSYPAQRASRLLPVDCLRYE